MAWYGVVWRGVACRAWVNKGDAWHSSGRVCEVGKDKKRRIKGDEGNGREETCETRRADHLK